MFSPNCARASNSASLPSIFLYYAPMPGAADHQARTVRAPGARAMQPASRSSRPTGASRRCCRPNSTPSSRAGICRPGRTPTSFPSARFVQRLYEECASTRTAPAELPRLLSRAQEHAALGNGARGRRAALGGRYRRRLRRRLAHRARLAHRGRRIFRAGEIRGQRGHADVRRLGARVPQALRGARLHRCGAPARSDTCGGAAEAARRLRFRHPAAAGEGFPRPRRSCIARPNGKTSKHAPGFVSVRAPRARGCGATGRARGWKKAASGSASWCRTSSSAAAKWCACSRA